MSYNYIQSIAARKGKYNKIILGEKKIIKKKNQIKSRKWEKIKLIIMKKTLLEKEWGVSSFSKLASK